MSHARRRPDQSNDAEEKKQGLWSSMLDNAAGGKRLAEKQLLVLGIISKALRIDLELSLKPQGVHLSRKRHSLKHCHKSHPNRGEVEIEIRARSLQSPIGLRWGTHTMMYSTQITMISLLDSPFTFLANHIRHSLDCSTLYLPQKRYQRQQQSFYSTGHLHGHGCGSSAHGYSSSRPY